MTTPAVFTHAALRRSLVAKGVLLNDYSSAAVVGDAIRERGLELAIMPGVRPARTFEAGFTEVFGVGLDGKAMKRKRV